MASGKLVFPIEFDIESAVTKASGDTDKALKRLATMINSRPLKLGIEIEQPKGGFTKQLGNFGEGSINALRMEMQKLVSQWNKLSEAQRITNQQTGEFTPEATKLINRYSQLVTASETYARSLEQIAAAAKKSADAEIKKNEKAQAELDKLKAKHEERRQILAAEETSLANVAAKMKVYQEVANKNDFGSRAYRYATEQLERLGAQYQRLKNIMSSATGNNGKDLFNTEKLKQTLRGAEDSIEQVKTKLNAINQVLAKTPQDSFGFRRASEEAVRLNNLLAEMQTRMADYKQKSFAGLDNATIQQQVEKLQQYRAELRNVDAQLHELQQARANNGGNWAGPMDEQLANNLIKQRKELNKQIADITKTSADMQKEREAEINKIIEQRKAKAQAIADKKKAETQATQANIAKLKEERRILNQQESSIKAISDKLNIMQSRLNTTNMKSGQFERIAKEVERLTKKLDEARRKVAELTGQSTSGASTQAKNARKVNQEYSKQLTYLDRLVQRMALYTSVGMLGGFVSKVREVTAQFELQKVSLGAILQDQTKANQLFSEIKSFALKSPVSILDLTKYTKQLAAYKIGYDELFETTKKLTDVSVGLGVSMDRVVLAYGQVRATGHLRASEIRQFTEMGVPIVEELAAKLSKLNGEAVTAADVMDMVSKRAISFDMVKEVFDDMTSAGGIFYNMQEKQGNTLYGLWAKLGDAASVMYDEIGRTSVVNSAIWSLIEGVTSLMKNWKLLIGEVAVLVAGFGAYKLTSNLMTANTIAASKATRDHARAYHQLRVATANSNKMQQLAAVYAMKAAQANMMAANTTKFLTAAKYKLIAASNSLKAALAGNVWTVALTVLAAIGTKIWSVYENANKLKNTLEDINSETPVLQEQSVRTFERLAKQAVTAADGSKKQKDALDELNRTYKDMVPEEALKIENLRKMKGHYDELTQSIREYIAEQQRSRSENAINEEEGGVQTEMEKKLRRTMTDKDLGTIALGTDEVELFFKFFRETALDTKKTVKEQFVEAFRLAGHEGAEAMWDVVKSKEKDWLFWNPFAKMAGDSSDLEYYAKNFSAIGELSRSIADQDKLINALNNDYSDLVRNLGDYAKNAKEYLDYVDQHLNSGETFLQQQENLNMRISTMIPLIQQGFRTAEIAWKDEWVNIVESVDPNDLQKITSLNMEAILGAIDPNKYPELHNYIKWYQKLYFDLVPQSATVQQIRAKMFAIVDTVGIGMDKMSQYLWDGSGDVDAYLKRLKEQQDELKGLLKEKMETLANWSLIDAIFSGKTKEQLQEEINETKQKIEVLKKMTPFVEGYTVQKDKKGKKSGGSKSDTRLQELQEIYQSLEKINKEYDDLLKKEGKTKAIQDVNKQFKDTLACMNKIGAKFNLKFDMPYEFETLQDYYKRILEVMKGLKNLKGGEKAILDFETLIGKAESDNLQKQIEKQLKELADRISRTKTAKEFYEKILGQTGDAGLAARLTENIFGEDGGQLNERIAERIKTMVGKTSATLPDMVFNADMSVNSKKLRAWAETNKDLLGDTYNELVKLADEADKDISKTVEGWMKATEKAKTYSDKLLDLRRRTQTEIDKINTAEQNGAITPDFANNLREGYLRKEAEDIAQLQYEAFKDSPMYVQMFDDLDHASTTMLQNMKARMEELKTSWKDLTPVQLKEMQSRLKEIDSQLARRNPFKALANGLKEYIKLSKNGDKGGNKSQKQAEKELNQAAKRRIETEEEYLRVLEDEKSTQEEIAAAKKDLDEATANEETAQKAVENWKKVKDAIGLSAEELFQMLDWAGDIAKAVADISEAMGADEEDVQYWNDIASALGEISGGIQDIVKSAMSGNVVGIMSSALTAIPKMFVGFVNLFSAGKIRKANKEIRRQQELIEQLEYSYSRLEKAAEKAFGGEYIRNHNQQLKTLKATAEAQRKQAEAERSKGKKADKSKIKEYEEAYRSTMDEIAEMTGKVSEKFLGTDLTSAARDFAKAWLEAYKEVGRAGAETSEKMREKFRDMIENMIVESVLVAVMKKALQPMFDLIDSMNESDFYSEDFWARVSEKAKQGAEDADAGATVAMKFLERAGISVKELGDDFTGIKRDIAGASEETMSNVAVIGNTLMYYVSPIPGIAANVAIMREIMQGANGGQLAANGGETGWTDWERQAMESYLAIQRNTADTVTECRRAAAAAEDAVSQLRRVIDFKGNRHGINVFMNS